ncbi:hypothetical protein FOCC_FOCC006584 [Frankliniella occidentalis]|nr:hypothetical protein FOCC_FOCC006584 [Frankliniella occidentalis]
MRVLKNFKNVTYSLAEKHQLYQALLREIEDYETFLPAEKNLLNINLYNFNLQVAMYEKNLIGDIYECNTFCYKGCTYKKGDVVVLRQEAYNVNVVMGRIVLLLVDDHGPHLVVEVKQTEFNSSMRFFELQDGDNKYKCISPDKLLSPVPHHVYTHCLVAQEMKTS